MERIRPSLVAVAVPLLVCFGCGSSTGPQPGPDWLGFYEGPIQGVSFRGQPFTDRFEAEFVFDSDTDEVVAHFCSAPWTGTSWDCVRFSENGGANFRNDWSYRFSGDTAFVENEAVRLDGPTAGERTTFAGSLIRQR